MIRCCIFGIYGLAAYLAGRMMALSILKWKVSGSVGLFGKHRSGWTKPAIACMDGVLVCFFSLLLLRNEGPFLARHEIEQTRHDIRRQEIGPEKIRRHDITAGHRIAD